MFTFFGLISGPPVHLDCPCCTNMEAYTKIGNHLKAAHSATHIGKKQHARLEKLIIENFMWNWISQEKKIASTGPILIIFSFSLDCPGSKCSGGAEIPSLDFTKHLMENHMNIICKICGQVISRVFF